MFPAPVAGCWLLRLFSPSGEWKWCNQAVSNVGWLAPLTLLATLTVAPAIAAAQETDVPHLLNCTVIDTVHADGNGKLIKDAPLVPGTRALGRITTFVVDLQTGVVRLPGLGDIAWIPAKGGPDTPELILTPVSALGSATSVSIHLYRASNINRFIFFETDRVMSGTCDLLQP
jgi:hypothetical protein